MDTIQSLRAFLPETFLLIGAFVTMFVDLFTKNKKALGILSILILAGTMALCRLPAESMPLFSGFYTLDAFTQFFRLTVLAITAVTILISLAFKPLASSYEGEYYYLFLFLAFALVLMAGSTNLLMIFLAVEFVSVLSYLFVGFLKKDARSKEASMKYFLFGSVASGIMLYGMSLLYGFTGSIELSAIQKTITDTHAYALPLITMFLFLVGLGFKISMAPFHMWAPDAYEAAPTPVTAFLTVAPKAVGLCVLIRVLTSVFAPLAMKWQPLLMLLSILTMTIGNVSAISQVNIKRLLAYSSIAQAGYILMGVTVYNKTGFTAVLIYLIAYAFTNLGAFTAVILVSNQFGNDDLQSYAGLSKRAPFLAASLTVFLLSLAGIPPLAGFLGKFYVFATTIENGFVTLAVAAALNSAIAAFYYFKIVRLMYLVAPASDETLHYAFSLRLALLVLLAGTILIGFVPSPLINAVQSMLPL